MLFRSYLDDWRYCGTRSLIFTGDLFGADMNYHKIPFEYDPLDFDAYQRRAPRLRAVVTNVQTGEAEYPLIRDLRRDLTWVRASASLPLISRLVRIDGGKYLDGGIADSIPLRQAMDDGFRKNVVVLTQAAGYRKKPNKAMPLIKLRYARYPRFIDDARHRHERYNEALSLVDMQERAGRAFVIRPDAPPEIGRVEKDPERLRALYREGRRVAEREFSRLEAFLSGEQK